MSREETLKKFLDSVNAKFKAHNTEESFTKSMTKIDEYKTEKARSGKARQDAASQFRIKFDALPSMPLLQTKVDQTTFPELENHWNEQTVGFISNLATKARTLAQEKTGLEKELNDTKERIKILETQLADKNVNNKDALSAKILQLENTLTDLTNTNELQATSIATLTQDKNSLTKQIAGHDAELKTMTDTLSEKQIELDEATNANKDLANQVETNKKLIEDHKLTNESLSIELETLKSDFVSLSSANATLLLELDKKKTVENDNTTLNTKIAEMESSLSEKEANVTSVQTGMEERIKQIENQYRMENAKTKIFHDMEKDLMKQRHAAAIDEKVQEITKNSTKSTAELTAQITTLEQEHKNALEALEQNKAALSELEKSQTVANALLIAEYEEQKVALETAKQACEEQKTELEAANAVCEEQKAALKIANDAMQETINANNTRIENIDSEINKLNAENTLFKQTNSEQANNHAQQIKKLQEEKQFIEKQNGDLETTLTTLQMEHDALKIELGKLTETYNKSTNDLEQATSVEELNQLILQQTEEIAKAQEKEKEITARFEIDACLIKNSIDSLKWTTWQSAKEYFLERYGKVDSVTGLQSQTNAISQSATLDKLIESFGMLKSLLPSSSQSTSVEPECMKNLADLIIKFLQSQKEIEETQTKMKQLNNSVPKVDGKPVTEEYLNNEKTKLEKALESYKDMSNKVEELANEKETTEGQRQYLLLEIQKMKEDNIKENASLSETQKEEMLKLLEEEKQKSNTTIDELNKELAKIKQELESSNMSVKNGLVTIDSIKDEKNKMEEDLKKHETDVSKLNDQIEQQKSMNDALKQSNLEKDSENANIKSATEQLSKQLSDAKNENTRLTAELTSQIEQNKTDVENAIEAIKDEETKNTNLQAQIGAKQSELTDLDQANEAQKQSLSTTINMLQTELTKNAINIVTLKEDLKTQTEKLEKTNAQIKSLTDEKSKIEASFNELRATNEAQKLAHDQAIAEAKTNYDAALAAATEKASAEQTSKEEFEKQLATAATEKTELETKLATETAEKQACEQKIQQLQNRELKLAKELLLLKLQLDLEKQIKASSVPSTVTSVAAPTYSNATVSNMFDDLLDQGDLDLKGGSAKQKLIMKGGALSLFDDENYIVIEKEKAEKLKTQLTGYQSRYKTMKEEIENLTKQIKTNASTTPICAFVNKMVNGNNQTELMKKYLKEIVLLKTQYAKNVKELLFEKIANQVNQQIVTAAFKSRSATSAPSSASKTSVTSQISPANISSLEGYIKPNIAFVPGNK